VKREFQALFCEKPEVQSLRLTLPICARLHHSDDLCQGCQFATHRCDRRLAARVRHHDCLRVSVALEEAEIPYIVRKLDLRLSEHRMPEHLSRNPVGKVPTLVERFRDGRILTLSQSNAILMYAAERKPPRLLPSDTVERALVLQRFFYFVTNVIAVSHAAFGTRNNGGDQSFLDGRSLGALAFAESFLENSTFMVGEAFSLADIAAFTIASSYQSRLEWDRLPKMRRWFDQVSARESLQRGMRAFD
jgi:GSH-dependent disulfide-bond oxidoreductase